MKLPTSTGQVAAFLRVTEPQLNNLVRRKKLDPEPTIVAGRRAWEADHVRQAASLVGITLPVSAFAEEVCRVP